MAALFKLNTVYKFHFHSRCLLVANYQSTIQKSKQKLKNDEELEIVDSTSLDSLLTNDVDETKLWDAVRRIRSLSRLVSSQTVSLNDFRDHPIFKNLCSLLDKKCTNLNNSYLIDTLSSLYSLKLPCDMHMVKSIQTQALWNARRMPMSDLIELLKLHVDHQFTDIQKKIFTETKEIIQRRWIELDDINDVCLLLAFPELEVFSEQFLQKLDDRILDLIESGSVEKLTKLFYSLSVLKRRPTPVLRSLSFHLCKKEKKFTAKQIATLLNSMSDLNFPDQNLLDRILTDLLPAIESIDKPSVMAAILTAVGQLRWKNYALLDSCTEWMANHVDECRVKHMVSFVLTCGNLNYVNENTDIIEKLSRKITQKEVQSPFIWLDYVWSLVILKKADAELVASVLTPQFSELISKSTTHKIKLMNVNAAAKYEMKNFKGPFLDSDSINVTVPVSKNTSKLKSLIVIALANFVPERKYLITNQTISDGLRIDAEFIMDKNLKPLPLNEYRSKLGNNPDSLKPLPYGANRIALMIWNFQDLTLNNEVTGGNTLLIRILRKLGYIVCEIQHHEFPFQEKILQKIQFLQGKIKEAVQNKYKTE